MEFAEAALEGAGLAVIPGSVFGEDKCLRISYATSLEILEDAIGRLRKFCAELK